MIVKINTLTHHLLIERNHIISQINAVDVLLETYTGNVEKKKLGTDWIDFPFKTNTL
jgi:hypothetical protein